MLDVGSPPTTGSQEDPEGGEQAADRHAVVAGHRRLDNSERQGGAGAFAESKPKIEQRLLAKPPQHVRMPAFGRNMGRQAMVERTGIERVKNGGGGTNHITIEDHRNALHARRDDRTGDRRYLAPADAAHHLKRIGEMLLVPRDRRLHRRDLSR